MNETIALLSQRRSVAWVALSGPRPTGEQLSQLLQVASRVPDHGKLAPWRFIVFEGEARFAAGAIIEEAFALSEPAAEAARREIERKRLALAPLVVGVVSRAAPHIKIPEWEQVLSAGAAAMNLVNAVYALGYGASWITEWYAYDRRVLTALGVLPHERIVGFVHIGTPARPPDE